ncbi:MAG: hypothetical protein WKF30_06700 [Pyrinomonadaceae bacterium]
MIFKLGLQVAPNQSTRDQRICGKSSSSGCRAEVSQRRFSREVDETVTTRTYPDNRPSRRRTKRLRGGSTGRASEMRVARALARRYRLPFVDLLPPEGASPIDYALLSEMPVELMMRYQFVPLRREGARLHIAMADPTDLERLDDMAGALKARSCRTSPSAGPLRRCCAKATPRSACCRKRPPAFASRSSKKRKRAKSA